MAGENKSFAADLHNCNFYQIIRVQAQNFYGLGE